MSNTYESIASNIQNSKSNVWKKELKKKLTNIGTHLEAQKKDQETWWSSGSEIDEQLSALKLHSENLTCLMKGLKEKGLDTLCPDVVEHPACMESTITSISISR